MLHVDIIMNAQIMSWKFIFLFIFGDLQSKYFYFIYTIVEQQLSYSFTELLVNKIDFSSYNLQ